MDDLAADADRGAASIVAQLSPRPSRRRAETLESSNTVDREKTDRVFVN
jgi:hypothetical protein